MGATLVALHPLDLALGIENGALHSFHASWLMTLVFTGSGIATLLAAPDTGRDRLAWRVLGAGLIVYGAGSAYYELLLADAASASFPTPADALWLSLYPFAFVTIVLLVRARFSRLHAGIWLDIAIGGTVVAALGATLIFEPVFDVTMKDGVASAARLAYPLGDLLPIGFVAVVWVLAGGRIDRTWALLGAGFAMLALADSVYVVQAAAGTWAPGGWLDVPYVVGTMLMAGAACAARHRPADRNQADSGVTVPVAFGLAAVVLACYEAIATLNPLATTLIRLTLLAVVVRLAVTLRWLSGQREHLAELARRDPLTGVANHRTLHERLELERELAESSGDPLSVVVLDMDYFKRFNDTYGHQEGDSALQAIARELVAEVGDRGMLGRVGGEEFAVVLPSTDADTAHELADRCRGRLARLPLQGAGISSSAGVASYPADDPSGRRLLELADGALYWAKRSGRGQTRRYDAREVVLLSSREQHEQVRALLEQPSALTPFFQPIVELATGRVAGYEALTRFLDTEPVRAPDVWFSQARRAGLGPALEARAIEAALSVPGRPAGTFLSINLSPAALMSPEVFAALPDDLSDIVIEVTEDELFAADDALRRRAGRPARPRCAHRGRRRRRRLRRATAADPRQARHRQGRPRADRGPSGRRLEGRDARRAGALRDRHRRRGVRRGHRGAGRAAPAEPLRHLLRPGVTCWRAPLRTGPASTRRPRPAPPLGSSTGCASATRSARPSSA